MIASHKFSEHDAAAYSEHVCDLLTHFAASSLAYLNPRA